MPGFGDGCCERFGRAEGCLPSRAIVPPVSYQVDTLAFGAKHTPEMGCYALQTLKVCSCNLYREYKLLYVSLKELRCPVVRAIWCGGFCCGSIGLGLFSSTCATGRRELGICCIRMRWLVLVGRGIVVPPHIVLLMPLAISTIQKRWLCITGIICNYLKSSLIRRSTSTSILPLMCLMIASIASGSTEW